MKSKKHRQNYHKGLWAEGLASLWLRLKGYRILARRFKTPVGEIDIVAYSRTTLIAIEVKAHKTFDQGLLAVDRFQRVRISRALLYFMTKSSKWAGVNIRFDIILCEFPRLKHIQNAWSQNDL